MTQAITVLLFILLSPLWLPMLAVLLARDIAVELHDAVKALITRI